VIGASLWRQGRFWDGDSVPPGQARRWTGQGEGYGQDPEEVAAHGGADWLVERSVPGYAGGYGHCTFTPQELTQAFFDLVGWGEYGVKPTPWPFSPSIAGRLPR